MSMGLYVLAQGTKARWEWVVPRESGVRAFSERPLTDTDRLAEFTRAEAVK